MRTLNEIIKENKLDLKLSNNFPTLRSRANERCVLVSSNPISIGYIGDLELWNELPFYSLLPAYPEGNFPIYSINMIEYTDSPPKKFSKPTAVGMCLEYAKSLMRSVESDAKDVTREFLKASEAIGKLLSEIPLKERKPPKYGLGKFSLDFLRESEISISKERTLKIGVGRDRKRHVKYGTPLYFPTDVLETAEPVDVSGWEGLLIEYTGIKRKGEDNSHCHKLFWGNNISEAEKAVEEAIKIKEKFAEFSHLAMVRTGKSARESEKFELDSIDFAIQMTDFPLSFVCPENSMFGYHGCWIASPTGYPTILEGKYYHSDGSELINAADRLNLTRNVDYMRADPLIDSSVLSKFDLIDTASVCKTLTKEEFTTFIKNASNNMKPKSKLLVSLPVEMIPEKCDVDRLYMAKVEKMLRRCTGGEVERFWRSRSGLTKTTTVEEVPVYKNGKLTNERVEKREFDFAFDVKLTIEAP